MAKHTNKQTMKLVTLPDTSKQLEVVTENIKTELGAYIVGVRSQEVHNRKVAYLMHNVRNNKDLFKGAGYESFNDYSERAIGVRKAMANRYAQVGEYIDKNGKSRWSVATKLPDGTINFDDDFSVSQISALLRLKQIATDTRKKEDAIAEFIDKYEITTFYSVEDIIDAVKTENKLLLPESTESDESDESTESTESKKSAESIREQLEKDFPEIMCQINSLGDNEKRSFYYGIAKLYEADYAGE